MMVGMRGSAHDPADADGELVVVEVESVRQDFTVTFIEYGSEIEPYVESLVDEEAHAAADVEEGVHLVRPGHARSVHFKAQEAEAGGEIRDDRLVALEVEVERVIRHALALVHVDGARHRVMRV